MKRYKILSPIEKGDKTYWAKLGNAYPNRDGSINLYLDGLPTNGRLQLREQDEDDARDSARPRRVEASTADAALPF